jgi:hypothetical protein
MLGWRGGDLQATPPVLTRLEGTHVKSNRPERMPSLEPDDFGRNRNAISSKVVNPPLIKELEHVPESAIDSFQ